jgi:hypothetical protein
MRVIVCVKNGEMLILNQRLKAEVSEKSMKRVRKVKMKGVREA